MTAPSAEPLLLCPLLHEARLLRRHAPSLPAAVVTGPGQRVVEAMTRLARPGQPVLLVGTAGGLVDRAAAGCAFVVTRVVESIGDPAHGGEARAWRSPLGLRLPGPDSSAQHAMRAPHGAIPLAVATTQDRPLREPSAKRRLGEACGADLVDCESTHLAAQAERLGVPWLVVRGVSDGPDDALPSEAPAWIDDAGRTRLAAVLGSVVRRPTLARELLRLGRRSDAAMRSAASLTRRIVEALRRPAPLLVFGGSFDPPQRAHVELPRIAARAVGAREILFVPAASNPLKSQAPAPGAERVAMLRLALRDMAEATISTLELERPGPSYTVQTLRDLRARLEPDRPMRLLLGSDAVLEFGRWREPEAIIELAEPVVLLRPPETIASFAARLRSADPPPPREPEWWLARVVEAPALEVSATEIRARLADPAQRVPEALIDPEVVAYARRRGLYAATAPGGRGPGG